MTPASTETPHRPSSPEARYKRLFHHHTSSGAKHRDRNTHEAEAKGAGGIKRDWALGIEIPNEGTAGSDKRGTKHILRRFLHSSS